MVGVTMSIDDRSRTNDDVAVTQQQAGTYRTYHDMSSGQLSLTVILALAEVDDTDPTDLVDNLSRYVDPDALDRLFRTRPGGDQRGPGRVEFEMAGYRVQVHSDGEIVINE